MMSERAIYKILGLFIQGDSREWTMVEMWSNNESLFLEFCEHVSKILELPLEFEN